MGSIANTVNYNQTTGEAFAEFKFTPGVNGDYAYPEAYYSILETSESDDF